MCRGRRFSLVARSLCCVSLVLLAAGCASSTARDVTPGFASLTGKRAAGEEASDSEVIPGRVDRESAAGLAGAGPPAHEGASAPYAPVGRYPFERRRFEKLDSILSTCLPQAI